MASGRKAVSQVEVFGKRAMAGGREVGVVEVVEEEAAKQKAWGFRLEFVAEVRRAVGKGSARPNMVKGRRRKVSSVAVC
jgi:hypothetical protein